MRHYDRSRPLIVIHVPKAAGSSFYKVLSQWFGRRLHHHRYREFKGRMPRRVM